MKKIDPSKIAIATIFMSLVTSVAVSYAEAPPSVSSPFGDPAADSSTAADEAPPSLGGTTTTTKTTTTPTTTTKTTTTPTTTTKTTTTPPPPPAPTSSATNITPKKLSKTGPELAILVLPSLLAGYFVGKGRKK